MSELLPRLGFGDVADSGVMAEFTTPSTLVWKAEVEDSLGYHIIR
jgi:hypothetical protein